MRSVGAAESLRRLFSRFLLQYKDFLLDKHLAQSKQLSEVDTEIQFDGGPARRAAIVFR
ncbi:hypothetical protein [Saccharopolyspora taberi]|uniref:Uncharacterized protein n=1 Tax=Saccharopolyspora taberi TaxID=60895 RepID=A0ABN3V1Z8_9PSEU